MSKSNVIDGYHEIADLVLDLTYQMPKKQASW